MLIRGPIATQIFNSRLFGLGVSSYFALDFFTELNFQEKTFTQVNAGLENHVKIVRNLLHKYSCTVVDDAYVG